MHRDNLLGAGQAGRVSALLAKYREPSDLYKHPSTINRQCTDTRNVRTPQIIVLHCNIMNSKKWLKMFALAWTLCIVSRMLIQIYIGIDSVK